MTRQEQLTAIIAEKADLKAILGKDAANMTFGEIDKIEDDALRLRVKKSLGLKEDGVVDRPINDRTCPRCGGYCDGDC